MTSATSIPAAFAGLLLALSGCTSTIESGPSQSSVIAVHSPLAAGPQSSPTDRIVMLCALAAIDQHLLASQSISGTMGSDQHPIVSRRPRPRIILGSGDPIARSLYLAYAARLEGERTASRLANVTADPDHDR